MAYSWRLNGLKIRFFEDDEEERVLIGKNAPGIRLDGGASYFRYCSCNLEVANFYLNSAIMLNRKVKVRIKQKT